MRLFRKDERNVGLKLRNPKRRMSAADRRRQLIEVALDVFSRHGFNGTTTREIAAAAGVNNALIFHHFPSKDALYTAVLNSRLESGQEEELLKEMKVHVDRNDDERLFCCYARHMLQLFVQDERFHRVVLFAALEGHETGLDRILASAVPIFKLVRDYVARRQREGALIKGDPDAIVGALGGMTRDYGTRTQLFHLPTIKASEEEIARFFTSILMYGIKANVSAGDLRVKTHQQRTRMQGSGKTK